MNLCAIFEDFWANFFFLHRGQWGATVALLESHISAQECAGDTALVLVQSGGGQACDGTDSLRIGQKGAELALR